jgi:hypothetical protein
LELRDGKHSLGIGSRGEESRGKTRLQQGGIIEDDYEPYPVHNSVAYGTQRFNAVFTRALKMLTGTAAGKRPLGRPRRRWEDNIRMDLKEIGINTRNWVDSAQDRDNQRALVKKTLNLRVSFFDRSPWFHGHW